MVKKIFLFSWGSFRDHTLKEHCKLLCNFWRKIYGVLAFVLLLLFIFVVVCLFFEGSTLVSTGMVHIKSFPGCSPVRLLLLGLTVLFFKIYLWVCIWLTFCLQFLSTLAGWFSPLVSHPICRGFDTDNLVTETEHLTPSHPGYDFSVGASLDKPFSSSGS